jgi:hypothetical protein
MAGSQILPKRVWGRGIWREAILVGAGHKDLPKIGGDGNVMF